MIDNVVFLRFLLSKICEMIQFFQMFKANADNDDGTTH